MLRFVQSFQRRRPLLLSHGYDSEVGIGRCRRWIKPKNALEVCFCLIQISVMERLRTRGKQSCRLLSMEARNHRGDCNQHLDSNGFHRSILHDPPGILRPSPIYLTRTAT